MHMTANPFVAADGPRPPLNKTIGEALERWGKLIPELNIKLE